MTPDPAEPADLVQKLRQQMILAQVRIMELEDERDELAPRAAELEKLLGAAQELADRKIDEAVHLERVRADLQAQFEHMRHMQHVTNEALNATRDQLARTERALQSAEARNAEHEKVQEGLLIQLGHAQDELLRSAAALRAAQAEAAARGERIAQLDAEQRAMKASRSWRWTAWLRSIERGLRGPRT